MATTVAPFCLCSSPGLQRYTSITGCRVTVGHRQRGARSTKRPREGSSKITPHRESGSTLQEHARTRHVSFLSNFKNTYTEWFKFFPFIHLPLNFVVFRFFLLSFCCLPSRKTTPTPDISLALEKVSKSPEQNKRPHKSGGKNVHS